MWYFFVYDCMNYVWMIFLYFVEMKFLKIIDFDIEVEFQNGNWVVNKNEMVLFCVFGVDNVLEYVNCFMKVSGGLVGIIFNFSV